MSKKFDALLENPFFKRENDNSQYGKLQELQDQLTQMNVEKKERRDKILKHDEEISDIRAQMKEL